MQAGDRVAILSATRYEWPIIDLAILSVGAVTVPIYETSSAEQVRFVLTDSAAVLAFAETDAHADTIDQLKGELPELRRVLRIDGSGPVRARRARRGGRIGRTRPSSTRGSSAVKSDRCRDADLHLGHHRHGPRAAS